MSQAAAATVTAPRPARSPFHVVTTVSESDDEGHDADAIVQCSTEGKSSIFGASFNFVNSIVGAGIIGIPVAIKECGFVFGILLLCVVAYLINRSVIMLIECGIRNKQTNLEDLSRHLLGDLGYRMCLLFMFLFAFGAMIAYVVIIGDTVPIALDTFLGEENSLDRHTVMALASVIIILPLCLLRDLSSLSWSSLLSILADVIMTIMIMAHGPTSAHNQDIHVGRRDLTIITYSLFAGIGTMSFAFVCQHNSFLVFQSMKEPTLARWKIVVQSSVGTALLLCMALGLAGYLSFGRHTEADVLNNFRDDARLLLAVTMVFTYPMECYVARHCIFAAINEFCNTKSANVASAVATVVNPVQSSSEKVEAKRDPEAALARDTIASPPTAPHIAMHVAVTLALWTISVTIAIVFGDLAIIFALTGALSASFLGYILPASLYLTTYASEVSAVIACCKSASPTYEACARTRMKRLSEFALPVLMLVFGIFALIVGVATVVYGLAKKDED